MQEHILKFSDQQLQAVVSLIAAAGSKGGDVNAMTIATDVLRLIQSQVDAAKAAPQMPVAVEDAA